LQIVYLILCIAGTVFPLAQFLPWVDDHGLNLPLLVTQASVAPISTFAWSDVVVTGVVVAAFVVTEGRRINMRHAWTSLLGLLVGPSLALPLFLLLRERHLENSGPNTALRQPLDC